MSNSAIQLWADPSTPDIDADRLQYFLTLPEHHQRSLTQIWDLEIDRAKLALAHRAAHNDNRRLQLSEEEQRRHTSNHHRKWLAFAVSTTLAIIGLALYTHTNAALASTPPHHPTIAWTADVTFASGNAHIGAANTAALTETLTYLRHHPDAHLQLTGHTDNTGNAETNLTLSATRAANVAAWFTTRGVAATTITTIAQGETNQIPATTHAANRHVQIQIQQP